MKDLKFCIPSSESPVPGSPGPLIRTLALYADDVVVDEMDADGRAGFAIAGAAGAQLDDAVAAAGRERGAARDVAGGAHRQRRALLVRHDFAAAAEAGRDP